MTNNKTPSIEVCESTDEVLNISEKFVKKKYNTKTNDVLKSNEKEKILQKFQKDKERIKGIEDDYKREEGLLHLAIDEAKAGFINEAKKTAEEIKYNEWRETASCNIEIEEAKILKKKNEGI
jgi:hypothetical protein